MSTKAPRATPNLPQSGARVMRIAEVFGPGSFTGMSRSAGYRAMVDGSFPKGFLLNPGTRAWLLEDLEAWARRVRDEQGGGMPAPRPGEEGEPVEPVKKRGRGRPRKHPVPAPAPTKRPRGRPRKHAVAIFGPEAQS